MLPSKNRLNKTSFKFFCCSKPIFRRNKFFSVKIFESKELAGPIIAVVAPKAVFKKAVDRNFVKRRLRHAIATNLGKAKNFCFIFTATHEAQNSDFEELKKQVSLFFETLK